MEQGFSSRVTINIRTRVTKQSLTLAEKAKLDKVTRVTNIHWVVLSGTSGKTYHVGYDFRHNQFTCSCNWGRQTSDKDTIKGNGSGCHHILAVVAGIEEARGRSAAFWASVDDARRQHRPIMIVAVDRRGNIVVETSRERK